MKVRNKRYIKVNKQKASSERTFYGFGERIGEEICRQRQKLPIQTRSKLAPSLEEEASPSLSSIPGYGVILPFASKLPK